MAPREKKPSDEAAPDVSAISEAITAPAEADRAPDATPDVGGLETRAFVVIDPVSLNGATYSIGAPIFLTSDQHADLSKAGVIDERWSDSETE